MKRIVAALLIVIVVGGLFFFGMLSGATAALMSGFCLWTPAILFLGYAVGRSGLSVHVEMEHSPSLKASSNGRVPRRQLQREDF